MIAGLQQAEKSLTKDMQAAERENTCGGWLSGIEHRLKGEDRLKEKIAENSGSRPQTPGQLCEKIPDAIRYTFCFEPESYADGYLDVKQRLEAREYRMIYSKNHWHDDPEYKGINTRWVHPRVSGSRCSSTPRRASTPSSKITHKSYERIRNPLTRDERAAANLRPSSATCAPGSSFPRVFGSIPDYHEEGR